MSSRFIKITFFCCLLLSCMATFGQLDKPKDGKVYKINTPPDVEVEKAEFIDPRKDLDESQVKNGIDEAVNRFLNQKEKEDLKNKGILTPSIIRKQKLKLINAELNHKIPQVDQYLGGFSSTSDHVTIVCRDFQYPDGDAVTIYINNIPLVKNVVLTTSFQKFKLPLVDGLNVISFKALNQGTSGPNTAQFMVFDNKKMLSSNEWNLATGAKATLSIAKVDEE